MKKLCLLIFVIPMLLLSSIPVTVFAEDEAERTIHDEIIYSILVDRFNNGRQAPSEQVDIDDPLTYHGGDIQGITDKLGQLKETGFTAISISPIMKNVDRGYHGYWIEDFYEVEEEFGTLDDLKNLVEEAHNMDMKVIMELETNYIATSSPLVEDDEKADWFKESDVEPIEATEWLNEVYQFDQTNPEVQEYLLDMASYWMNEADIDGYTLHAADQSSPEFIENLAKQMKQEKPDFYLLATTLQGSDDVDFLLNIDEIDAVADNQMFEVMNEVFTEPDQPVSKVYETWEKEGSEKGLLYVDNMNTARFSNNFAEKGRIAVTTWNIALSYLFLTPGVPIVYQGSEVPMYGPGFPENQYFVDFSSADPDLETAFEKKASLRGEFPALAHGDIEQIATDEGLSLFKRTYEDESVYVAINNDSESRVVEIDGIDAEDRKSVV